jgi:hypothetical protein
LNAEAGTLCRPLGTRVATETCGHVKPAKLRNTICEYWIWVAVVTIFVGTVMSLGGSTRNVGTKAPG